MSTIPAKYQPETRTIDDEEQLRELYCERDLTMREIADEHVAVSHTTVHQRLQQFGIIETGTEENDAEQIEQETESKKKQDALLLRSSHRNRGRDPPLSA